MGDQSESAGPVEWQLADVTSPQLDAPVSVITALNMPYITNANRFQNLSLYLPATPETSRLVGTNASYLPQRGSGPGDIRYLVHIHGGAWRDPQLTSSSIEPTVAHAFADAGRPDPVIAIAALNYTISAFPDHPTLPYDANRDNHSDPAREGTHPQHVSDVLHGLALLRSLGLAEQSYIPSGHSCGACLAWQAIFQSPRHYGLGYLADPPCPATFLGLNGLYDLPQLVDGLGASHAHLRDDYEMLLSNAFGADKRTWPAASPARFDPHVIAERGSARGRGRPSQRKPRRGMGTGLHALGQRPRRRGPAAAEHLSR